MSNINMPAVYIADYAGVLILFLIILARGWELPGRKEEGRILLTLLIATMVNCLIDPVIFMVDGKPGAVNRAIIVFGNSALFLYNLIVGTGMVALIARHINKRISRIQYITMLTLTVMETVLLVVNLVRPIVFSVDDNNVYKREPLYFIYIAVAFYLFLYSLFLYVTGRVREGSLRYFPVWEFIIPILTGVTIQTVFYGVSSQPVSFAIAFCSIVICLQKECLFIDKLTGVYNRYELDKIVKYYTRRRKRQYVAIMLDMNGFKSINDGFSHSEGDEALKSFATLLTDVVGNEGNVIRFAGDEFVVIMDSSGPDTVRDICSRIRAAIDAHNAISGKSYQLSASMGGDIFDTDDTDRVIRHIDELMYNDKIEFYKTHDRRVR